MQDVQLAIDALRAAAGAIVRSHADSNRMLGDVLALARLLRSNGVLASALDEFKLDPLEADMQKIEVHEAKFTMEANHYVSQLAKLYHQTPIPQWTSMVDANGSWKPHKSGSETFREMLRRVSVLGGPNATPELDIEDIVLMEQPIASLVDSVSKAAGGTAWSRDPLILLRQLHDVSGSCKRILEFRKVCGTRAVPRIAARVSRVLAQWETDLGNPAQAPRLPDASGLEKDVPTLATQLEFALSGGRSRRQALIRAKAYFEQFYDREARSLVEQEEGRIAAIKAVDPTKKPQAQRELVLRRPLDRFLFSEGFFPLTELRAASGRADLLLAAESSGARPLLAEVKQAVRVGSDKIGRKDVVDAVGYARTEVTEYAGSLRAHPGWESIEPVVVVFHTSHDDVSDLEDLSTILINIGETPSKIRPARRGG